MSISSTLDGCLRSKGCLYEVIRHPHTHTSTETAQSAHVPGDRLAKTLLLEDKLGYVAAVLPSTYHLHLSELQKASGRDDLTLADESELREVFKDCDAGAVPPVGMAYGMPTYIDSSLMTHGDVYFEAGDHENVVHMDMDQFMALMRDAKPARFAYRMQGILF